MAANTTSIKIFTTKTAVKEIGSIMRKCKHQMRYFDTCYVEQWYGDKRVFCYVLYEDGVPVSFALLSTCDFDPMKEYANPKMLNFIYTLEGHRRKGYALQLVEHVKKNNQFTVCCNSDDSKNLFEKSNCKRLDDLMYRHP
ncbi:uncharacterized protein LOC126836688 [Adelges cooleyi]|uniref:uncharacterized protein LOC126836688 n=1 Tax=Adelges cooleyi TaxID=133065 RepID=UPI0021804945|nr:uncharacterized protein LOC126836688 [Adelges cooleyi]